MRNAFGRNSPNPNRRLCAICGLREKTTDDHIPPQNLYPKPRDNIINLNTVPACTQCNNGSSKDDEVFKLVIGLDTGAYQNDPQKIIDSIASTVGNNQRIANQIFSTAARVFTSLQEPNSHVAVAVTFDHQTYHRVITRIVRGLHWMETGKAMAESARIDSYPGAQLTRDDAANLMHLMMQCPLKTLNKGTFTYRFHIGDDGTQIWGLQFFSRHTTFAFVHEVPA
jgi:hypothetical protein